MSLIAPIILWHTGLLWDIHTCTYMYSLCAAIKSMLFKEMLWIAMTFIFSVISHLFLVFPLCLGAQLLLQWSTTVCKFFFHFTITFTTAIPENSYLRYAPVLCKGKHYYPSCVFAHFVHIILCSINYSDPTNACLSCHSSKHNCRKTILN